ncbi:MAG: hypothetical protein HKN44_04680, partial [Ilumatobacter sp.]|nr:hypothetical protein [Ilumatobacter sp.]
LSAAGALHVVLAAVASTPAAAMAGRRVAGRTKQATATVVALRRPGTPTAA